MKTLAAFFSSGFFLSHALYRYSQGRYKHGTGCGLIGSAWGLLVWVLLPPLKPLWALAFVLVITALAILASHLAQEYYRKKDDSRIVVDEFAGYLWAVVFLPKTALILTSAFILFRILDVYKPLGIRRIEDLPGGWGCVLDDVASGIVTFFIIQAALITF